MSLSGSLKRVVSALLVRSMPGVASVNSVAAAIQDTALDEQCSGFMAVTVRTLSFYNCPRSTFYLFRITFLTSMQSSPSHSPQLAVCLNE